MIYLIDKAPSATFCLTDKGDPCHRNTLASITFTGVTMMIGCAGQGKHRVISMPWSKPGRRNPMRSSNDGSPICYTSNTLAGVVRH